MRKVSVALGIIIFLAGLFLVFHPTTTVSGTKVVTRYVYLPGSPDVHYPERCWGPEITTIEDIKVARVILYVDSPYPELKPEPKEVLNIHEVKEGALVRVEVHGGPEKKERACQIKLIDPDGNLLLDNVVGSGYKFDFTTKKGYYELEVVPVREGDWYGYGVDLSYSYFYPIKVFHPNAIVSRTKADSHYAYLPGSPDSPERGVHYGPEITTIRDIKVLRAILYVDLPRPELKPEPKEALYIRKIREGSLITVAIPYVPYEREMPCRIKLIDPDGNLLLDEVADAGYEFFGLEAEKGYYKLEVVPVQEGDWYHYGHGILLSDSYSYTVKEPVILFQPYGPLGILCLALGGFLTFWGLPANIRFKVLGPLLALYGIGFAFGFSFNWFYTWLDSARFWSFGAAIAALCSAIAGGFFIGRSFGFKRRWLAVLLAFFSCLGLFFLALSTFPGSYYSYADPGREPYPYYFSFSGDYMVYAFMIFFFQFCIFSGLFGSFLVGLIRRKKSS